MPGTLPRHLPSAHPRHHLRACCLRLSSPPLLLPKVPSNVTNKNVVFQTNPLVSSPVERTLTRSAAVRPANPLPIRREDHKGETRGLAR